MPRNRLIYNFYYEWWKNIDKFLFLLIILLTKKNKTIRQTILFSPCAASFDKFKNFEDRGFYFNTLVKKYLNGK